MKCKYLEDYDPFHTWWCIKANLLSAKQQSTQRFLEIFLLLHNYATVVCVKYLSQVY